MTSLPVRLSTGLCLAAGLAPLSLLAGVPAGAQGEGPPNIVFILADDLGWGELGCYGQEKIRTPNIDRLAAEGMRFTQHYSGAPTCAPSRNALLTGLHLGHTTIRGNRELRDESGQLLEGQQPIPESALTIAEVLKGAGYTTGAIGKWGLGPVGSTGDPNRQGFDLFYGYNCQRVAHSYFPPHLWRNGTKEIINRKPVASVRKQPEGEVRMEDSFAENYAPDLMEREADQFINRHAKERFFLYLPFVEPHVAMHPPKRLVESYPKEWESRPYRGENGYLPHPRPRAAYAAMITHLDEHVGKVMEALRRNGLEKKTVVVFTSDNGTTFRGQNGETGVGGVDQPFFNSTRNLRGYKASVFEGGLRVPYIVRWPGKVKPGTISDFPAYFPDHFATLAEVAGLTGEKQVPGKRDGVSLLPTLTGKGKQTPRNPMVWTFAESGGLAAVRLGDYKVIRQRLNGKNPGPWQVYNLREDIGETKDLAAERPEVVKEVVEVLKREVDPNPLFPITIPGVNAPEGQARASR